MKKKYKLISSLLIIILMSSCLLTGAQAKSRNYSGNIKNVLNEKEVYDRVCEIYKACNSAFITKGFYNYPS